MKVVIEGNKMKNIKELHNVIKEELEFPQYYGANLDALWDCLTGWIDLPMIVEWRNYTECENFLGNYAMKVLEVFKEAEEEMDDFFIIVK
jgi:ribonuclease inhibitor